MTPDQLRLLKYDNIKSENGITNFDIGCPSKLFFEESVLKYSFNYAEGGQFSIKKNELSAYSDMDYSLNKNWKKIFKKSSIFPSSFIQLCYKVGNL